MAKDVTLHAAPADGISSVCWLDQRFVVAASWDCGVHLLDSTAPTSPQATSTYRHKAPVLDVAPGPKAHTVLSGGVDMDVRL